MTSVKSVSGSIEKLRKISTSILTNHYKQSAASYCQTSSEVPKKTCLYDFHVSHNGKMVDFSGWYLPVQYREAIAASHVHTRTFASLFDVGHMMQTYVKGKHAAAFIESLTTVDLENFADGTAGLTVFTNENGGILDDLIVTRDNSDNFFIVSNAGRRKEDSELLKNQQEKWKVQGKDVYLETLEPLEQGLIALQGPASESVLQPLVRIDLKKLKFMRSVETSLDSCKVRISRCGYTGEDGFEISIPAENTAKIAEMILENPKAKLAGLGARDSLRLEAGLCLYGHDINEDTTPVEAALLWLVAKKRRQEANFPGAVKILQQIKNGVKRKRVGLSLKQGPPAREGAVILTVHGEKVGNVTSGGPSPSLGKPIAMGYVPIELTKQGSDVLVEIRGKTYKAVVTKMPFVKTNYFT